MLPVIVMIALVLFLWFTWETACVLALKDESDQCASAETRENADSVEDPPKNAVGKLWIEERVLASEKKPRKSNRKKQTNGQVEINVRIGWTA
jgi:hypothetical protein